MTANEAHVRAVVSAADRALLNDGLDWRDLIAADRTRLVVEAAVATLTPLIAAEVRAEVAAAIRARADEALAGDGTQYLVAGLRDAAHIATEEAP